MLFHANTEILIKALNTNIKLLWEVDRLRWCIDTVDVTTDFQVVIHKLQFIFCCYEFSAQTSSATDDVLMSSLIRCCCYAAFCYKFISTYGSACHLRQHY